MPLMVWPMRDSISSPPGNERNETTLIHQGKATAGQLKVLREALCNDMADEPIWPALQRE